MSRESEGGGSAEQVRLDDSERLPRMTAVNQEQPESLENAHAPHTPARQSSAIQSMVVDAPGAPPSAIAASSPARSPFDRVRRKVTNAVPDMLSGGQNNAIASGPDRASWDAVCATLALLMWGSHHERTASSCLICSISPKLGS